MKFEAKIRMEFEGLIEIDADNDENAKEQILQNLNLSLKCKEDDILVTEAKVEVLDVWETEAI